MLPKLAYRLSDVQSYATQYGQIVDNEVIVEAAIGSITTTSEQESAWKLSECYPSPYVAKLKGIIILPGSSILLTNLGRALSDEIDLSFRKFGLPPKLSSIKVTDGPYLHIDLTRIVKQPIPCGIHLFKEHESNYFHWLVEVLPRLFLCERLALDVQIPILVSDDLHPNLYALLDLIRDPGRNVLKLSRSKHYHVKNLIYPSDVARILNVYDRPPSTDTTYLPVNLLTEMAREIKRSITFPITERKKYIYLKRSSTYRRLINEEEIEEMLTGLSFETIDLNAMTIAQQISLFSKAEIIVGPSGAGMANIMWCEPLTKILILHSDHPFKKYPYWDALGRVSDSQIRYVAGPRAFNVTGHYESHDDYSICPKSLYQKLRVLLNK